MSRLSVSGVSVWLAVLAIAAVTLFGSALPAAAFEAPAVDLSVIRMMAAEQALLELTNADRVQHGLAPLEFDPQILDVARQRAASQLGQGALSHYDANGGLVFVKLLEGAGLRYGFAGENLARSPSSGEGVIERIEQALMRSPTHRKNILEQRFQRAAMGYASDDSGRIAFAQLFRD
jgi:uncharacterized protein YkwD